MNLYLNKARKSILIICLLLAGTILFAQSNSKITIKRKNITLQTALTEVQEQSKMSVAYNDSQLPTNKISLDLKNLPLEQALKKILQGTGFTYMIKDRYIMIVPQQEGKDTKIKKVTGSIVDAKGEPLIGVTVMEKGSKNGAITDLDGKYAMTVSGNAVLQFSYVGYQSIEKHIAGNSIVDVTMREDNQVLDEVVVTALGIKRAEKALSYNVQQINADEITDNKDANFVNSLNGKVAGVNINASSSGVGGVSKVVMRGSKSIMQSSNALYVIDGVPMLSGTKQGGTEFDSKGTTEPIADINPEDIESMSVLTGAAAAALYGSDAANGAIVITTKKGREGRLKITVNSNTEISNAFVMPKFQNRYGTGSVLSGNVSDRSWGDLLNSATYRGYDPGSDYFQTGITGTESISLSTGTEKNQMYASIAAVNSRGIIPNNKYDRYNLTFRNTASCLNDKLTIDLSASYIHQNDRNMTNQGTYNNPLVGAYLYPRGEDWENIRMYERYDMSRNISTQYWPVGDAGMAMQNPYWINYRNLRENARDRYMLTANANYKVLDWLSVSGRVRMDNSVNDYREKFYAGTNTLLTEMSNRGLYGTMKTFDKQMYADFLVNISKTFGEKWNLQANIGGSIIDMRSDALEVRGPIADETFQDEKPGLTNGFFVQNLSAKNTKRMEDGWHEQTQSVFASVELGYKSTYYLTLTGRNDWPSQLAGPNSKNNSFFYPSVGFSVVLSELMPNLNPDYLSYMKLRGSFASVGTAFERYIANPLYEWVNKEGQWSNITQYPIYNLKPERTESFELGMSIRFFKNFNLDLTYYNTTTRNQTFNPQIGVSGYSALYIQTGAVRNQGVELALGYKNTWDKFTWESDYTFSANQNKITSLADNVINPATNELFSIETLNMGGLGDTRFLLKEGGTMGDLYSLMDLKRDDNGKIYIDSKGKVATQPLQNSDDYIKLGSVLPKANMAWRNSFKWNNFHAGFMISARLGGVVFSRTQAMLDDYGVSEASAAARDRGFVLVNGRNFIDPESWYHTVAGGNAIPQFYTYSATNVRLQEASFGYTFSRKMLRDICDITVSVVGRNLWMIYNKAPFDPESVASTNNFYQGIDYFMMPSTRNIGCSVTLKF